MENISKRIKQFIDFKGISVRSFEQKIGASNGLIANSIKKNTDIQSKWVSKIIEEYTEINPTWLLTGKGESYVVNTDVPSTLSEPDTYYVTNKCENCKRLEKEIEHLNKELKLKDELLEIYRPKKECKKAG